MAIDRSETRKLAAASAWGLVEHPDTQFRDAQPACGEDVLLAVKEAAGCPEVGPPSRGEGAADGGHRRTGRLLAAARASLRGSGSQGRRCGPAAFGRQRGMGRMASRFRQPAAGEGDGALILEGGPARTRLGPRASVQRAETRMPTPARRPKRPGASESRPPGGPWNDEPDGQFCSACSNCVCQAAVQCGKTARAAIRRSKVWHGVAGTGSGWALKEEGRGGIRVMMMTRMSWSSRYWT